MKRLATEPGVDSTFPSSKRGGRGSCARALARIAGGRIHFVVVLCKWLGHSDYHAITATCRTAGVPIVHVNGGFSAARRAIQDAVRSKLGRNR